MAKRMNGQSTEATATAVVRLLDSPAVRGASPDAREWLRRLLVEGEWATVTGERR